MGDNVHDTSLVLIAKVLLAYYHHSSTDHLQFRLAVWETVRFVRRHRSDIMASSTGYLALQLWYRLCTSHRPSKPPALLIEGEGPSSFGPNLASPGADEDLHLKCILGMSSDDLIYDILIKTLELRARMVVFHCTSSVLSVPERSPELGRLAHRLLNTMMNRPCSLHEENEAASSFARGDHLHELLQIQKRRLEVWRSRVTPRQLPSEGPAAVVEGESPSLVPHKLGKHRDRMNYLYYLLCRLIFEDTTAIPRSPFDGSSFQEPSETSTPALIYEALGVIDAIDLQLSNLVDIYTFSLSEVLLQLLYSFSSEMVFNRILDSIWPQIEASGRGFENSHMPTHLAKRIIALMAEEWQDGRRILLAIPAIPEDTPKAVLFDVSSRLDMIILYDSSASLAMPQLRWSKLFDIATIQRSSHNLAVVAGTAYIFGGELRPREPVDSSVYQISTRLNQSDRNVASTTGSIAPPPRLGAASTTLDGKIYIFSGRGGAAMLPIEENGSFWVFDTAIKAWSQVPPDNPQLSYPAGRSYHALTNDGKDTIFLHAGCPEKGRLSDLWAFNVSSRHWQELPSAPEPRRGGPSIAYANGKLYRMNGFDGKTEQGGALDVFDCTHHVWHTIKFEPDGVTGPGPRSVSCLLSVYVDDKSSLVTMFGERDPSSLGHQGAGKMLGDVWVFDIGSQTWSRVYPEGEQPLPRGWFDADVVENTGIIIHGGLAESNERLSDAWLLEL
ncbi:uncharacterized protein Z518_08070 [Rhinocladiella mackenziei CBS 650.93]|uniref:Rhinocladiella mackenziei CBS 650.93 unplaced genomic scaffold supercont1.6, whole genome shotgun sequence n=1 Tax=Rhinocladiella mackenziei CBS 650.93 TaxID=1442369 RepID=A0A0D2IFT6_9EURO|nr:uncharacterized protein Z518_08070 [Rhinocladiella mackenziei CBS 650.93]KIX02131.1 hypothetical protein Z518_08070 [Rhinocladiella mackenziei CBS 650.93]